MLQQQSQHMLVAAWAELLHCAEDCLKAAPIGCCLAVVADLSNAPRLTCLPPRPPSHSHSHPLPKPHPSTHLILPIAVLAPVPTTIPLARPDTTSVPCGSQ